MLAFRIPFTDAEGKFDDVSVDAWEYDYVMAAYSAGLINGISETQFGSGDEIKREDMACIINRYIGQKSENISLGFSDAEEISDYAKEAVSALVAKRIINGRGGLIAPKGYVTYKETAIVISRLLAK